MKLRETGMPDETYWESLLDVTLILDRLGIDDHVGDVVELGCGYGTFTIPVAARIGGSILAFDVNPEMVERTRVRAEEARCWNVISHCRDVTDGYGLPEACVDGVLLFNALQGENAVELLRRSAALARPGGWLWAINWRHDVGTPRGPSMAIRPNPEQVAAWAESTGLLQREGDVLDLPPWHYGWRFKRILSSLTHSQ